MDLLASLPKQRRKYCLLAFHYYGLNKMLMASNEHCSIAHYTSYCAPYITQWLLSNDLCNNYSVDHVSLHLPCYNAIIKNVIKSISSVVLGMCSLIDITKINSIHTDTGISIGASIWMVALNWSVFLKCLHVMSC